MGLYISATGIIHSLQRQAVHANNIANLNTTGYEAQRLGAYPFSVTRDTTSGPLVSTGQPLNVAPSEGFFQIRLPGGSAAYTRDGSFGLDAEGHLVTAQGYPVEPTIQIPTGATNVQISSSGVLMALLPNQTAPAILGQLQVFQFNNPEGLTNLGHNLLAQTPASGRAHLLTHPLPHTLGTLRASNTNLTLEQAAMLLNRQATQANFDAFQTQDEVLGELLDISE